MNKYFVIKKDKDDVKRLRLYWNVKDIQFSSEIILSDEDFNKLWNLEDKIYLTGNMEDEINGK